MMVRRILLPALLLAAPLFVHAQQSADETFKAIYTGEETWLRSQRGDESPEDERRGRIPRHLPRVDPATQQKHLEYWNGVLAKLDALDVAKLSPENRLNYKVYRAQKIVEINDQKFKGYEMPVNSDTSFWSSIEFLPDQPFRTEEDYTNYIAWLADLPRYFHEEQANMRAGLKRGFTAPQVTLVGRDRSLATQGAITDPAKSLFYKPLLSMPPAIAEARRKELRQQTVAAIRPVLAAYREMDSFYQSDYLPHARKDLAAESLPDGKAYYRSLILEYATTTQTPEEIHQIGLDEMAKIHAEMLATMKDAKFAGGLPEFLQFLRTDPQFYSKTPEELLMRAAYIAKEFDGVASRYFGYLPRQRFGIKPVAPEIAPYYTSARGGATTYWVNTYDLPSRGLYSLPALTLHESAPGHSMQLSLAQEHKDLPRFRNAYISAYGEGWALYCERLGVEMGMYHSPYEHFGMLSYQAWRAARLVVDTGIHSKGWTLDQARKYMHDNTALSDHEIETEVDRYISWPGQALSYYLGELAILKARYKAEAALGPKFNLRAFHDAVLATGAVPLPVLEENVDAFIAGGGIGPYPEMER